MPTNENNLKPNRRLYYAVFVPAILVLLMILVFVLEKGMDWDFHKAGVYPRHPENLWGVFSYVFIHSDIGHLFNNVVSFFVLSTTLYYFYNRIAGKIMWQSYLISGVLLWVIGRENWHIGASGMVYALASFLFFSGLIRRHLPLIAISLVITFLYGNMFWHLFPWQPNDPISWEGHLSGGITGFLFAVLYRKAGPQKPLKVWDEEEGYNEEDAYWNVNENENEDKIEDKLE